MIVRTGYGALLIFRETLPPITLLALWDILVVAGFQLLHWQWLDQPALPISLLGSALAIFVGIRNNAAYGRWWEARSLWGQITNNSRSFGRQVSALLGGSTELVQMAAAYPYYLRTGLSSEEFPRTVRKLVPDDVRERVEGCLNRADALLYEIGQMAGRIAAERNIDGALLGVIDRILSDQATAQGGLERIKKTPLPIQYSFLPNLATHLFCIILPLSVVQMLGWMTPLGSCIIGILFQMLDRSGSALENPFRPSPYALPMLSMARNIQINLAQTQGWPAPLPLQSQSGVLD